LSILLGKRTIPQPKLE